MDQIEEKMLFPSYAVSDYYDQVQVQNGEQKPRRRRKKAKGDGLSAELKKRRLNDDQVKFLELSFKKERKLETGRKVSLASELGLDPKQVAVWFQNRRARHKSKQLEEEYMKLKSAHDSVVVEKCHLENEVMKLKERMTEMEEEMKKLSMTNNTVPSAGGSSPSSSFSTITYHPQPMVKDFGVEAEPEAAQDIFYVPEYNEYGYPNFLDWGSVYGI
ncbi:Homeobox-leucine zipper family protein [Rhynchospora pubera]|uniref:Homeobox-leucine zipper protein n=1 Tax=Rhynchospora pubera TaxID=906938 RepID=A0AAV8HNZ4_9POAL|nr:Homeobox-leucine zipper family protein [Rhynchospora pubera]